MVRPGATIGRVGVPHDEQFDLGVSWANNTSIAGGTAAVTTYDKGVLLKAVLDGEINPGKVFTKSYKFDDVAQAYADMDQRKTIKSLLTF